MEGIYYNINNELFFCAEANIYELKFCIYRNNSWIWKTLSRMEFNEGRLNGSIEVLPY